MVRNTIVFVCVYCCLICRALLLSARVVFVAFFSSFYYKITLYKSQMKSQTFVAGSTERLLLLLLLVQLMMLQPDDGTVSSSCCGDCCFLAATSPICHSQPDDAVAAETDDVSPPLPLLFPSAYSSYSHPFSLIMCASSIMNLPSLYF